MKNFVIAGTASFAIVLVITIIYVVCDCKKMNKNLKDLGLPKI